MQGTETNEGSQLVVVTKAKTAGVKDMDTITEGEEFKEKRD